MTIGRIHSIQSLGTLDGPGIRFVVFSQGCPLRCKCCHNPDTWAFDGGKEYTAEQLLEKALKFKEYFGKEGGITVSGGEPLCQAEFFKKLFKLCKKHGISTCLDTSGYTLNKSVKELLDYTDRVLLDIKYLSNELYKENVGCEMKSPLEFLDYLNEKGIPTTLRQVIIPSVNDQEDNVIRLKEIALLYDSVDKIELLPFRKMCQVKYEQMNLVFPFADKREPTKLEMQKLESLLK